MEDAGICYGHLVNFLAFWYILWHFGICILWTFGTFPPFWYIEPRKIWQPWQGRRFYGEGP
jgi:hypothetical protein